MPLIKPPEDWSDETSSRYNGPTPRPGLKHGVVKGLWRGEIKTGENAGKPQITVLVEIDKGEFKGAGIFNQFNLLKQNAWSINQFLEALTDGSEKQKETLKKWFWTIGYVVGEDAGKVGLPITRIGKKFDPIGKPVAFVTKLGTNTKTGEERAEIDRFVVPVEGGGLPDEEESEDTLDEMDSDATVVEENEDDDSVAEDDETTTSDDEDDDGDDPWG